MKVDLGEWQQLRQWAEPLRFAVFVEEQKVPAEIELDEFDSQSVHAIAFDDAGEAIGTARLLPDGHIGRMAVARAARNTGVGTELLKVLMDEARRRGHTQAMVCAQTHARGFYEKYGYCAEGGEYDEAGIPHVDMRCTL
ncbi:MAG: GNAT family N-acetyltransferase [Burkholderiaceae bacterium]